MQAAVRNIFFIWVWLWTTGDLSEIKKQ